MFLLQMLQWWNSNFEILPLKQEYCHFYYFQFAFLPIFWWFDSNCKYYSKDYSYFVNFLSSHCAYNSNNIQSEINLSVVPLIFLGKLNGFPSSDIPKNQFSKMYPCQHDRNSLKEEKHQEKKNPILYVEKFLFFIFEFLSYFEYRIMCIEGKNEKVYISKHSSML